MILDEVEIEHSLESEDRITTSRRCTARRSRRRCEVEVRRTVGRRRSRIRLAETLDDISLGCDVQSKDGLIPAQPIQGRGCRCAEVRQETRDDSGGGSSSLEESRGRDGKRGMLEVQGRRAMMAESTVVPRTKWRSRWSSCGGTSAGREREGGCGGFGGETAAIRDGAFAIDDVVARGSGRSEALSRGATSGELGGTLAGLGLSRTRSLDFCGIEEHQCGARHWRDLDVRRVGTLNPRASCSMSSAMGRC
jgi:hypothetical protein